MSRKDKKETIEVSDLITVAEAAKLRGVSRQAIHALIARGRLSATEMFGKVLVHRSEISSFEPEQPGPKTRA